jgi:sec-independent protein translocase protein TatA
MFGFGFQEMIIVGIVAVLLFGKRLPEVAKSLGQSYTQFRKGLNEIQTSMDYTKSSYTPPPSSSPRSYDDYDDYDEPTAPKFEPPPADSAPSGDDPEK